MQTTKREWKKKNIDAKGEFKIGFVFQIIYWSKHKEKKSHKKVNHLFL